MAPSATLHATTARGKSEDLKECKMKTETYIAINSTPGANAPMEEWAIYYGAKGWPVFPCKIDKTPYTKHGVHDATTDRRIINKMWGEHPEANIGFHAGDANMLVLDLDPGHSMYELEESIGPIPETSLRARTPRGGQHLFFSLGKDEKVSPSTSKLAPNVDVRSHNSYVLLSPSKTIDGSYVWESEEKPHYRTEQMFQSCNVVKERHEDHDKWIIEPDMPENIDAAIKWLTEDANIAIQSQGGESMAFKTAAHLSSLGISEERAFDLILEHWNPRCDPPWSTGDIDHLRKKVENGYAYNNSPPGNLTRAYRDAETTALFEPVVRLICSEGEEIGLATEIKTVEPGKELEPPSLIEVMQAALGNNSASYSKIPLYNLSKLADLPDPKWDMEWLIGRAKMGMIVGKWGQYKTFVALDMAVALASGVPWPAVIDKDCKQYKVCRALRVLYIAAEGGAADYNKRTRAALKNRPEIDHEQVNRNFVLAAASAPLDTVAGQYAIADAIEGATKMMGGPPEVIFCDTLAKSMAGEENSNTEMGKVQRVAAAIQRFLDCTFVFVHHTGKDGDKSGRGASSMPAGLDFLLHVKGEDEIQVATVNVEKQKDAAAEKNIILQGQSVGGSLAFSRVSDKPGNPKNALTNIYRDRLAEIIEAQQGRSLNTTQLVTMLAPGAIPDFDTMAIEPQRKATEGLRSHLRRHLFEPKQATSVEAQDFRDLYRVGQGHKIVWRHKDAMVE
jgi:hypothetical protein